MFKRFKLGTLSGLLLLLLLVLGACSQDGQPSEGETDSGQSEASSGEPQAGGTYTAFVPAGPPTLNVFAASSIYTHQYAGLVYNKLVTYDMGEDVEYTDYNVVPDLAEEWDISDDGTVYTFHLRDTTWHDIEPVNGRELVADDVVATFEHIMDSGHQASLLDKVDTIEASDDKTVVITLKEPFAPFLNFMANHFMWILPQEAIAGEVDLDREAVGTGPFMLEEYEDNIRLSFVRNPNYFEEGKPYLDKAVYQIVSDQSARMAAFRTGDADYMGQS